MSNFDMDDNPHRLEGTSGEEKGGLVIMKRGPSVKGEEGAHVFKKPEIPRTSLLGLDRLAAIKRDSDNDRDRGGSTPKRSKILSYRDEEEEDVSMDRESERKSKDKHR